MLIWLYFWLWILLRACVSLFLKWLYISPSQIFTVLICGLFSGNASIESNGPDLALYMSHQSGYKLHFWGNELLKQTYSHEDSKAEGSLIFSPGADERLLLSKHINLIFSYEHALQVTQAKCLREAFYFRTQKLQFRNFHFPLEIKYYHFLLYPEHSIITHTKVNNTNIAQNLGINCVLTCVQCWSLFFSLKD